MHRSIGSDRTPHRRAWSTPTVGALAVAVSLVACGIPPSGVLTGTPSLTSVSPAPSAAGPPSQIEPSGAPDTRTPGPSPTASTPAAGPATSGPPVTPVSSPTGSSSPPAAATPSGRNTTSAAPTTTRPSPTPKPVSTRPTADDLVARWAGVDIEAFDTHRRVVALTFDGGGSADGVRPILEILDRHGVPATFFVTGSFARSFPGQVRAIAAAGHPVGNHSDTHPYFTRITDEQIRAELAAADRSISALTGTSTAPLFRFPYGDVTPYDIGVVNRAGYIPVRWTVDTYGWKGTSGGISEAVVKQRVLDRLRPGEVILMHVGAHPQDGSTLDAAALPALIEALRDRGYGFATLSDLLDDG